MSSLAPRSLAAGAALVVAFACGEVPTLPDGIAYISPIVLPSPAVAAGDTLRDSLGRAAPLRVLVFDQRDSVIPNVSATFLVTPADSRVILTAGGLLKAPDSVRTLQLVARVGDRLQTTTTALEVVLQPDELAQTSRRDSVKFDTTAAPRSNPLVVTVKSSAKGTSVPVRSIIVRFEISRVFPASATTGLPDSLLALLDDQSRMLTTSGRTAVDTTDASGMASRRVRARLGSFDSLEVVARATNLRGVPLRPDTFVVVRRP